LIVGRVAKHTDIYDDKCHSRSKNAAPASADMLGESSATSLSHESDEGGRPFEGNTELETFKIATDTSGRTFLRESRL